MFKKSMIAVCFLAVSATATAQGRVLLWDRVEAGMTVEEVRAIYP